MKTLSIAEAESDLSALLKAAQKERVVVTQSGKPSVVLVGVECYDAEDIQWATSAEFWEMIQDRRKGRSIPLSELKARLNASPPSRPRKRSVTKRGTKGK